LFEQLLQLRFAVLLLADRLGVDAERDVVGEDPAVDLPQVYITLAPVAEGGDEDVSGARERQGATAERKQDGETPSHIIARWRAG